MNQRLAPGGGPHGYLSNLREALTTYGDPPGLHMEVHEVRVPLAGLAAHLVRLRVDLLERTFGLRRINHQLRGELALRFESALRERRSAYEGLDRAAARGLFSCDLLFAHDPFLAERLVKLTPREARERLVLVPHAPTFAAHEIAEYLVHDVEPARLHAEPCVRRQSDRELAVMGAVRAVSWPSPGAREGYPGWLEASTRDVFIRTGVPRPASKTPPRLVRERWGVRPGQRVLLFMGRPHPHKGFGRFVDWADWYAGTGEREWLFAYAGPEPRPNWTRRDLSALALVGYQTDNGAAYQAADLVVFPNRHSYLDIGLLECLSLGAPVATTASGGHRDVLDACPELARVPESDARACMGTLAEVAADFASHHEHREGLIAHWRDRHSLRSLLDQHAEATAKLLAGESRV